MFKHYFQKCVLLTALLLLVGNTGLWAQETVQAPTPHGQVQTPKERAERASKQMTKQYQLNPKQQQQVIDIYLDTNKKLRDARKSSYKTPQAKKTSMKGIKQERREALRAMLNPEQQQKMDKHIAKREAEKTKRMTRKAKR
ncbi:MAG: hypothetical protein AB8B69_17830 [Chitinophagales bacterium]